MTLGRPPLPDHLTLTQVKVGLLPSEKDQADALAQERGLSRSSWCREAIQEKLQPPLPVADLWTSAAALRLYVDLVDEELSEGLQEHVARLTVALQAMADAYPDGVP